MTMTGAAAATRRTIISSRHSKHPPLDRIHNHERFQSSGTDMTFTAAKPWRTFISPKKLLYGLSGHLGLQNDPRIESSDTDLNVAAATQQRTFISPKKSKQRSTGRIHQQNCEYVKKKSR